MFCDKLTSVARIVGNIAMHDAFISYSSNEYSNARAVRDFLERNGVTCWMAPESIPAGADYAGVIPKAIAECRAFVLILSPSSQDSVWVRKELDVAIGKERTIIPFVITNFKLNDTYDFLLSDAQWCYAYSDRDKALQKLLDGVKTSSGTYRIPPKTPPRQPKNPPKQPVTPPKPPVSQPKMPVPDPSPLSAKPKVPASESMRTCKKCGKAGMTAGKERPYGGIRFLKAILWWGIFWVLNSVGMGIGLLFDNEVVMAVGMLAAIGVFLAMAGNGFVKAWLEKAQDGVSAPRLMLYLVLAAGNLFALLLLEALITKGQSNLAVDVRLCVFCLLLSWVMVKLWLKKHGKGTKTYKCSCGAVETIEVHI